MDCRKLFLFGVVTFLQQFAFAADLNVLFVNDKQNMVAKDSIEVAFEYLKKNTDLGVNIVTRETVEGEESDVFVAAEKYCKVLDGMIDASTPPDLILDSTRAGVTSEVVKSLTLTLGLPTVSMSYGEKRDIREWRDLTGEQTKYLIQLRPPADMMTDVVRQIVDTQNISNAAILFDDTFVMDHKYKSLLMNIPVRHIINQVKKTDAELEKMLMRLTEVDMNNFFIFGTGKTIERVMAKATMMKLYGKKYAWFAATKDDITDFNCKCTDVSVVFVFPKPEKAAYKTIMSEYGLSAMPEIDAAFYFDVAVRALVAVANMKEAGTFPALTYTKCDDYTETTPQVQPTLDLRSALQNVNTPDLYGAIMVADMNGMSYMSFDLVIHKLQFRSEKKIKTENVGMFEVGVPGNLVYKAGKSLAGFAATTIYRVVTVVQPPFVYRYEENGMVKYKGYCIDLINELKVLMNFEYEIFEAEDGQYGQMNEEMEWNGMVRELVDKKADIALGALAVMAERENVVDFTVPYYDLVGIIIMMKKPKVPTNLFKFLSVLKPSVWGCILAAYFFTSVLMWLFDKYSPYSYQNNQERYQNDEEKRYFNLKECLWFCMTSLTPQGGGEAPKNISGRIVAAIWWLFGFIIIASYTANLAAFLTVSRLETPVESLQDLSNQYKIQYSPMNGSATMTYFERMAYIEQKFYEIWKDMSLNDSMNEMERAKLAVWDYPVSDKYTKMWHSMQEVGLPENLDVAIERVRNSSNEIGGAGYAFLGDATDIRYQVLTNCDLQMIGEEFSRKPYALAVQQGSPLKDQFNDAILKLLNQRKLETLKERWWNQNPEKKECDDDDDTGGGISIYNIGGVFIVIFVGIGLAIITLIFEYWYYKNKKPEDEEDLTQKQLQAKATHFGDKSEYRTHSSNIAPVGNPW